MQLEKTAETILGDSGPKVVTNFLKSESLQLFSLEKNLHVRRLAGPGGEKVLSGTHKMHIKKILFSELAKIFVSVSENDQVVVWSAETLEVLKKFQLPRKEKSRLVDAFFSEFDTRLVLVFDSKIVEIEQICRLGGFLEAAANRRGELRGDGRVPGPDDRSQGPGLQDCLRLLRPGVRRVLGRRRAQPFAALRRQESRNQFQVEAAFQVCALLQFRGLGRCFFYLPKQLHFGKNRV